MKESPEDKEITARMQPGVFCRDGFLGSDRRPLSEIIDTDRSALQAIGVTNERIAARMNEVLTQAAAAFGAAVTVSEHFTAEFIDARGEIPSPFGDGLFHKGEVVLIDRSSGQEFHFTPLSIHMIAAHGFYQGMGSRYRISPETLCRLFGLAASGNHRETAR